MMRVLLVVLCCLLPGAALAKQPKAVSYAGFLKRMCRPRFEAINMLHHQIRWSGLPLSIMNRKLALVEGLLKKAGVRPRGQRSRKVAPWRADMVGGIADRTTRLTVVLPKRQVNVAFFRDEAKGHRIVTEVVKNDRVLSREEIAISSDAARIQTTTRRGTRARVVRWNKDDVAWNENGQFATPDGDRAR